MRAAGHVVLDAHMPLTAASIAKLASRVIVYAVGLGRPGRGRRRPSPAAAAPARSRSPRSPSPLVGFLGVLAAKPETVRFYLQYGYNWIPAGAWLAAAYLVWRGRDPQERDLQWRTGLLVALALGAATANTYASFNPFPNALFPEATPYVLPLAAAFFAWLTCTVRRGRPARGRRRHGVHRRARRSPAPGSWSRTRAPRRRPSAARTAAWPRDPPRRPRTSRRSSRRPPHAAGEPVLFAPQLTALYVMADRAGSAAAALAAARRAGDARRRGRRDRAHGQRALAVTDRTPLSIYQHGAFGTTYDRRIADWLRRDFDVVSTVSGTGEGARTLDIWLRRTP